MKLIALVILTIVLAAPAPALSQSSRIRLLKLEIADSSVTLLGSTVREGRLKPTPSISLLNSISFEVTAPGGEILWQGNVPYGMHEYVDEQGVLHALDIPLKPRYLLIRIPEDARAKRVLLYETTPGPGAAGKTTRKPLGIVTLD